MKQRYMYNVFVLVVITQRSRCHTKAAAFTFQL